MKIAISGKGGVGKTLLASLLSNIFAESGYSVIAIDADLANLSPLDSSQQVIDAVKEIYQALMPAVEIPNLITK